MGKLNLKLGCCMVVLLSFYRSKINDIIVIVFTWYYMNNNEQPSSYGQLLIYLYRQLASRSNEIVNSYFRLG